MLGLDVSIRVMHLRLERGMRGGIVGGDTVVEVDAELPCGPLEGLFGGLVRVFCPCTERVGKACRTSKYGPIGEVCVCVNLCILHICVCRFGKIIPRIH